MQSQLKSQSSTYSPSPFYNDSNTSSDDSIFAPGGSKPQSAVRRAELMPNPAATSDANATSTGIKTLHFSIKPSTDRPLNLSHEYLLVFDERADFAGNQIALKTGTLPGSDGSTKDSLLLQGNSKDGAETLLSTPFALMMDFTKKLVFLF
jgi:hypothetical protein